MENFIVSLLEDYLSQEAIFSSESYRQCQAQEWLLVLKKKLVELKLFLLQYRWKDSREQLSFEYEYATQFCGSYIFVLQIKNIQLAEKIMTTKAFRRFIKGKKRSLEKYCRRMQTLAIFFENRSNDHGSEWMNAPGPQWDSFLFCEEACITIDDGIFTLPSIALGKLNASKKLLKMLAGDNKSIAGSHASNSHVSTDTLIHALNWTDTGMSLTEIAYALKYSGAINKGNVEVKAIADALAKTFNMATVNVYRNKQDLYNRKNPGLFLDRLRKDLVRGMEDSDDR